MVAYCTIAQSATKNIFLKHHKSPTSIINYRFFQFSTIPLEILFRTRYCLLFSLLDNPLLRNMANQRSRKDSPVYHECIADLPDNMYFYQNNRRDLELPVY